MKCRNLILAFTITVASFAATAQPAANDHWVGIWNAHVDGLPTNTLTLAADTGELGGTVVLDMLSDEGGRAHVIASEPHVLMNPHLEGGTLTFQVRMNRPGATKFLATFEMKLTSPGIADFHCLNCGASAPVVELTRAR